MDHQTRPACLLPETELYPLCGKRSAGAFGLSVTGALRTCGRPARIGLSEIARWRRGHRRANVRYQIMILSTQTLHATLHGNRRKPAAGPAELYTNSRTSVMVESRSATHPRFLGQFCYAATFLLDDIR